MHEFVVKTNSGLVLKVETQTDERFGTPPITVSRRYFVNDVEVVYWVYKRDGDKETIKITNEV